MLKREEIRIRDPFIITDKENQCYYMYGTTALKPGTVGARNTFSVYKSCDLENFEEPKVIFDGSKCNFWATRNFWAAEVHKYKGKYYLFGSCITEGRCRATHIFVCDTPELKSELAVGGAQNAVSAWINGQYLGRHEGYSAPFEMLIPDGLLTKGENTIVLAVSNIRLEGQNGEPVSGVTSRAACECTGGIGNVEIRQYNSAIRDVYVTTSEDCTAVTVHVDALCDVNYKWTLMDGKTVLRSGDAHGNGFMQVQAICASGVPTTRSSTRS